MELYTGQLKNYNFNIKTTRGSTHRKTGNKSYKRSKCYDIFTFDLENTNAWVLPDGTVIPYHKGETDDYWNELTATSLVYIWQFGVNDTVYYGRDLWDFLQILDDLPDAELQIFIHNLSHEFCFLRNILTVENVFARSPHKPMKCIFKEYPLYTFRCSYIMTNLSLENWGKQIGIEKKTGQLDYDSKLRTPLSYLSEKELEYCEFDILVMYHGIKKEIERYGSVFEVPLTSTGKVRKSVKSLVFEDKNYNRWIKSLVPDLEEYKLLLKSFQGGYCHCNKLHANKIIDENYIDTLGLDLNEKVISHWDFTSSYPTVLLSEKYPYTRFYKRDRHDIVTNDKTRDKYAFIYKLKFTNLRSNNPNSYISASKCEYDGTITKDNGRVINCYGELYYTCTDADFDIINWLYEWDKLTVIDSWYARKEYLPKPFLEYVLQLYADKTELKGVKGQEDFYMQQKAFLNSLYGMCVTALIPDECNLTELGTWEIKVPDEEEIKQQLNKLSDKTKEYKQDYFLDFAWGVFCTAYSRKNLFKCALGYDDKGIQHSGYDDKGVKHSGTENGYNCIYFDTDSIFCLGRPDFSWYNEEITEKLKKCCNKRDLDFNKTKPLDIKGKVHPLGIFDAEEDIKTFRCNHAKCYLEQRLDNEYYMTISGINKSAVKCLNCPYQKNKKTPMENFTDGYQFNKDADYVKKLIPTYCENQPEIIYPDGYISRFKYGKNLRNTGYKISLSDDYTELLRAYEMTFDELDETQLITFRKDMV